ncbi:DUF2279 domain-containing protein [Croceibacterium ferulae]|uniref:DUF2279 domain-containing protein n=1 Tax=Croceibacterium ferulae TaxID=1854641 RepID=UPI000EB119F7|nr:DUF2279 domain-containing protein [Croceibacterium ferulae]
MLAALPALAILSAVPARAGDLAPATDLSAITIQSAGLSLADWRLPADGVDLSRITAEPAAAFAQGAVVDEDAALGGITRETVPGQETYGPKDAAAAARWADPDTGGQRLSFASQADAVKWEFGAVMLYYTATNGAKLFDDPEWPHGQVEGWFGRDTNNMGVDKLTHAYSSYVISELLHHRLRRKTGDAPGIQYTAAALGFGAMLYTEFWDSIEPTGGWSWEDVAFNGLGAGFSALRNSVPGLDQKLDYRLMIQPQEGRYRLSGKKHFEAQWHFFALKLAGFDGLRQTPLRYVELDLGYRAEDFTNPDREAGIRPKRHVFVGVSLNFSEIMRRFAGGNRYGRAAASALEYIQPPYTMLSTNITE